MTLVKELGDDADLLTRNDAWLEEARRCTAAELDRTTNELRAILLAQRIKFALQQKNLVAVQELLRDTTGDIKDIIVRIMSLPDALSLLSATHDVIDQINQEAQIVGWDRDGYDIDTSAALRRN